MKFSVKMLPSSFVLLQNYVVGISSTCCPEEDKAVTISKFLFLFFVLGNTKKHLPFL